MFCCLFTFHALLQCLRIVRTRTTVINIISNTTETETRTAITSISMISVLVSVLVLLSVHFNEFNKSLPINSPEHVVFVFLKNVTHLYILQHSRVQNEYN